MLTGARNTEANKLEQLKEKFTLNYSADEMLFANYNLSPRYTAKLGYRYT